MNNELQSQKLVTKDLEKRIESLKKCRDDINTEKFKPINLYVFLASSVVFPAFTLWAFGEGHPNPFTLNYETIFGSVNFSLFLTAILNVLITPGLCFLSYKEAKTRKENIKEKENINSLIDDLSKKLELEKKKLNELKNTKEIRNSILYARGDSYGSLLFLCPVAKTEAGRVSMPMKT